MSRWGDAVTETVDDAKRFWTDASLDVLHSMMEPRSAWAEWLKVAAGVITSPGSVFEAGCGIGLLTEVLPPGCSYYGCDVNAVYVAEARSRYAKPGIVFEVRDFDEVIDAGERFDWVLVPSLFGMFPEPETYRMIGRFWEAARMGLAVTSVDKRIFGRRPLPEGMLTSHHPDELRAAGADLPGAERVQLIRGREVPSLRGDFRAGGLALHVWREGAEGTVDEFGDPT